MYRIQWKSRITGKEGHGEPFPENRLDHLRLWRNHMNEKYPDIDHWIGFADRYHSIDAQIV